MSNPSGLNLTNCDKEPIQFLGKIQPHGFLVGVSYKTGKISHVSGNISNFVDLPVGKILGKKPDVFNSIITHEDSPNFFSLYNDITKNHRSDKSLADIIKVKVKGKDFYFSLWESEGLLIMEFEPETIKDNSANKLFNMVSRVLSSKTDEEFYAKVTRELKALTGYERVMVYRFLEDGSGEVVGECIDKHVDSFFGQRYPESDIPRQARALYRKNLMRMTADVNAETVEITGAEKSEVPDLTFSSLRAVSPTHISYLKNMGVQSSYSISIIVNDELWGLMALQNCSAPKYIDLRIRQAAKLLTQLAASQIESRIMEKHKVSVERFQNAIVKLQHYLTLDDSLGNALIKHNTNLLSLTEAQGVALLYNNSVLTSGKTPRRERIIKLAEWLIDRDTELYYTDKLAEVYPEAERFLKTGAGVMSVVLNEDTKDIIIWFKPENVYEILWAGEPVKKIETSALASDGKLEIKPRKDFTVFKETVKKTSEKWKDEEKDAALKITRYIKDQILRRAQKQLEFNRILKDAYNELDSFTYTVSHDLRTPLTVIRSYAQFLVHSKAVTGKGESLLKNIVSGTDRISFMLEKLLELSKISRQELLREQVNTRQIIDNVIKEQMLVGGFGKTKIEIGETPSINGNGLLLYHVFSNIIGNALKYSSREETPIVEIKGSKKSGEIVYEISDNGIGMNETELSEAFKLFKRLQNATDFEGTGAGLAIVKKVMERHGGNVHCKSKSGKGTTFSLVFPDSDLSIKENDNSGRD